jgi:hypothetical protein
MTKTRSQIQTAIQTPENYTDDDMRHNMRTLWTTATGGAYVDGDRIMFTARGASWAVNDADLVADAIIAASVADGKIENPQSGSRHQQSESSAYCGHDCPVTHRKCCAPNGPCHDCR